MNTVDFKDSLVPGWRLVETSEKIAQGDKCILKADAAHLKVITPEKCVSCNSAVSEQPAGNYPNYYMIRECNPSISQIILAPGWRFLKPFEVIRSGDWFKYSGKADTSSKSTAHDPARGIDGWEPCLGLVNQLTKNHIIARKENVCKTKSDIQVNSSVLVKNGSETFSATVFSLCNDNTKSNNIVVEREDGSIVLVDVSMISTFKEIYINEYKVEPRVNGVQIGCTFVSTDMLKQVAKMRNLELS